MKKHLLHTYYSHIKSLRLASFIVFMLAQAAWGQKPSIIPQPNGIEVFSEKLAVADEFDFIFDPKISSDFTKASVDALFSYHLRNQNQPQGKNGTTLVRFLYEATITEKEGYQIQIDENGITVKAGTDTGLFYGIQTLRHVFYSYPNLATDRQLPHLNITDTPRFPYRAMMLDPARHMLSVSGIKDYLDAMAMYKFNTLHLHLTDDHGWRFPVAGFPKLLEVGSKRDATFDDGILKGGYYTKEELKALVDYAKDRHITIIPEVDIPGHGHALLTAYPEFACVPDTTLTAEIHEPYPRAAPICIGNPDFYDFYEKVMDELADIFPSQEIHIGGDEVNKEDWAKCPKCQGVKKTAGLKSDDALMDYLFDRVNQMAKKRNKNLVFWHEEGHQYPKNQTVILWRLGTAKQVLADAQKQQLQLICAPGEHAYFDYPESKWDKDYLPNWIPLLSLKKVYDFNPAYGLSDKESYFIRGVEATIWGESVKNIHRAFYMTFPRAFAMADAGWTQMEHRNWEDFNQRLKVHLPILLDQNINYRPPVK